jgi:hypothetical protein
VVLSPKEKSHDYIPSSWNFWAVRKKGLPDCQEKSGVRSSTSKLPNKLQ